MKRLVTYSVCALCCCVLFLYSPAAVSWASAGFLIWRDSLLPALLPFFVCASVMQNAGVSGRLERVSLIFLSLISGAPSGARLLSGYGEPDARHTQQRQSHFHIRLLLLRHGRLPAARALHTSGAVFIRSNNAASLSHTHKAPPAGILSLSPAPPVEHPAKQRFGNA